MDSVTALHWAHAHHTVVAVVSFDYGAKHNAREIPFAREHALQLGLRHEVIALPFVNQLFASDLLQSGGQIPDGHYAAENMKQTVVPFRNAIMLSIACGFAESAGAQGDPRLCRRCAGAHVPGPRARLRRRGAAAAVLTA